MTRVFSHTSCNKYLTLITKIQILNLILLPGRWQGERKHHSLPKQTQIHISIKFASNLMEKLVKTIRMHASDDLHDGALGSQVPDSLSPLLHRAGRHDYLWHDQSSMQFLKSLDMSLTMALFKMSLLSSCSTRSPLLCSQRVLPSKRLQSRGSHQLQSQGASLLVLGLLRLRNCIKL